MSDRLKEALTSAVRGAAPPAEYAAAFWATIVSQAGDRIDVRPVDQRLPPMAGIPLLAGVAQWKLTLAPGGHVLVGWGGADPSQPYVIGFAADVLAAALGIECPKVTIGTAAAAVPALLTTPYRTAEASLHGSLQTFLAALQLYAGAIQSIADPTTVATTALTAAIGALNTAISSFEGGASAYLSTQVKHS
jgi:hypothetical protein